MAHARALDFEAHGAGIFHIPVLRHGADVPLPMIRKELNS